MGVVREFNWTFNEVYEPVFFTDARYIDICGGRAAGRSHFGTNYFLFMIMQPTYFRGCFLRNVFVDIRDSLFKDFTDRIEEGEIDENLFAIDKQKMTVLYKPTGNTIISKGFKKSSGNRNAKLKSLAGITHILIEEADENNENDVNTLDASIRTNKIDKIQIIMMHNPPPKNHWIVKRFYNLIDSDLRDPEGNPLKYYKMVPKHIPNVLCIHSVYQDNLDNLNSSTIELYEAWGTPGSPFYNEEKYYVDVLGMVPEGARGRIYRNWIPITDAFFDSLPYESYYGLDFGYSEDPVGLVEIKSHNNRNFWRERIYLPGLTNPALAARMRSIGIPASATIYADSSEPKSIQELKDLGYKQVKPADKGPDSVLFGIKQVGSMENYATEGSKNLWKENQEYKWKLDDNGDSTNEPVDKMNHLKDGGRYAITTRKQLKRKRKVTVANTSKEAPTIKKNPLDWLD